MHCPLPVQAMDTEAGKLFTQYDAADQERLALREKRRDPSVVAAAAAEVAQAAGPDTNAAGPPPTPTVAAGVVKVEGPAPGGGASGTQLVAAGDGTVASVPLAPAGGALTPAALAAALQSMPGLGGSAAVAALQTLKAQGGGQLPPQLLQAFSAAIQQKQAQQAAAAAAAAAGPGTAAPAAVALPAANPPPPPPPQTGSAAQALGFAGLQAAQVLASLPRSGQHQQPPQ